MSRTVEVAVAVNANVKQTRTVDLDADSLAEEVGKVPAAVAAYVTATEYGDSLIHKTVLTCTGVPLSVADDAGVAQYGGVQVYTFPEGLICSLGAIVSGSLTMGVTGTFIDAFTGVNALGSVVATTGATLVAGEATWLQSTANATAAAKVAAISSVSVATQLTETSARVFDGTATPAPVFLNFAIADDATHTAGTGTFTGTITIAWLKVGDK
jgi:hypothetical protein